MGYITSIGTANPTTKVSQATIAEFMVNVMKLSQNDSRKLRTIFKASAIESRYSVIDDYKRTDSFDFYTNTESFPTTKQRSNLFQKEALPLSMVAIKDCLEKKSDLDPQSITHLITVSCTGMYAPGLDIDLIKALGLSPNTHRTCINFMGCYAAFNGLKLAESFCSSQNSKVLLVCTELCSIHFQREATDDNMLANALFADGSAALLIEANPQHGINLKLENFFCDLATNGENEMAWQIGDHGFEMKLSTYVPTIIQAGIKQLTESLLKQTSVSFADLSFFAIHPGGKRILEAIEKELGITKEQNKFAYDVLKNFGNMSSPTVLFVLNEIYKTLSSQDNNKRIMSFAFGPGLTLESMILKIEQH
jgi:prepilin-type processing-associated H-X9-DG protein